ncbi:anhydro-N-acetylmuramic acid kinase [Terriglobus aquaticus]|uniref:Anhydro-N-acetylmuramic acid kinase n=1 Tax=Terriglobus aquaticus TaxID=940139 RepID=A0ABW9KN53_9BACT|nr:anhydro-N-acetylmuramic acid kinase [Terriglobus aquaticus]
MSSTDRVEAKRRQQRASLPYPPPGPLVVAGVMSGTSADGVDVALVRISPGRSDGTPRIKLLGHTHSAYPSRLRAAVLAAMDARSISTAELARLHWRLGEVYAEAILAAEAQLGTRAKLAGVHGQTVYHQGAPAKYLGTTLRCTWQLGEAAEIAARTGLPVVSDFRPADMAAGGQGAPLVPMLDRVLYAHPTRNRILQNLGGIANMAALPAGSTEVLAFDSGPANVVIDGAMQRLYNKRLDRDGRTAAKGQILQAVLADSLRHLYFAEPAPKSCGREEFGGTFVDRFIAQCRTAEGADADVIATATALTAESILEAYRRFVWPFLGQHAPLADAAEYIVAGGGSRNASLMRMLREGLEPLGIEVSTSDDTGIPAEAKEAVAFALLAWLRWHGLPGNVPSATGAKGPVLLGRITL